MMELTENWHTGAQSIQHSRQLKQAPWFWVGMRLDRHCVGAAVCITLLSVVFTLSVREQALKIQDGSFLK